MAHLQKFYAKSHTVTDAYLQWEFRIKIFLNNYDKSDLNVKITFIELYAITMLISSHSA